MEIKIEHNGAIATCLVKNQIIENGNYRVVYVPFNKCDIDTQLLVIDAFRTIEENWKRERNKAL